MKIRNIVPSLPHHIVVTFDDGRRARLGIAEWLERHDGLGTMLIQGRFSGDGVEWPRGERLSSETVERMLDEQNAIIS
jgi:hypothetical protein